MSWLTAVSGSGSLYAWILEKTYSQLELGCSLNPKAQNEFLELSLGDDLGINKWWNNTFVNPIIGLTVH